MDEVWHMGISIKAPTVGAITGPKNDSASNRDGERRGLGLVLGDGLKMGSTGAIVGGVGAVAISGLGALATRGRHWDGGDVASFGVVYAGGGAVVGALLGMSGIVTPFRNEG